MAGGIGAVSHGKWLWMNGLGRGGKFGRGVTGPNGPAGFCPDAVGCGCGGSVRWNSHRARGRLRSRTHQAGECSMVSLREPGSPRAAPCRSDAASPRAPQNVPFRPARVEGRRGNRREARRRSPDLGFCMIVAAGRTETDPGLRVLGFGWAGSGCGDWVCGDSWKSAGGRHGVGRRGGIRTKGIASPRLDPRRETRAD
jgi:hypothetical protein